MKKNILKSLMLAAVVSTVGIGSVYAAADDKDYEAQSKNVADYKIELKYSKSTADLVVEGINTKNINSYFVKYTNKDATKPAEIDYATLSKNINTRKLDGYVMLSETSNNKAGSSLQEAAAIANHDMYAFIYNCTKRVDHQTYCSTTTDTPIKVQRDSLPEYGSRYQYYFFSQSLDDTGKPEISIFPKFPYPTVVEDEIKLNVKIGIIEDSSVIKSMALNEAGAKEKLYNYAKSATNGTTYSGNLAAFHGVDFSNYVVQNGKYYYVFADVEDPDNKYIDLSDVSIAMGEVGTIVNDVKYSDYNDVGYIDNGNNGNVNYEYGCYACTNDYVWTVKGYQASTCKLVDSITSKGNCVKSVKTGVEDYLVPGALAITIGGAIIALLKKKTHFRKI